MSSPNFLLNWLVGWLDMVGWLVCLNSFISLQSLNLLFSQQPFSQGTSDDDKRRLLSQLSHLEAN